MNPIEQAIQDELKELSVRKLRLEQALALLQGQSPQASAAQRTGTSPATKLRKQWRVSKAKPWKTGKHAVWYTIATYDLLEGGRSYTSKEILDHANSLGKGETNKQRIQSSLQHMKDTGRIIYKDGKWRRKFARHPEKQGPNIVIGNGINTSELPDSPREVAEYFERLANEGKVDRTIKGDQVIYSHHNTPTTRTQ